MDFIIVIEGDLCTGGGGRVSIFPKVSTFENLPVFGVGMAVYNVIKQIKNKFWTLVVMILLKHKINNILNFWVKK